jgi:hypothetical protein
VRTFNFGPAGSRRTARLQRRIDIPDPIRSLLGHAEDLRMIVRSAPLREDTLNVVHDLVIVRLDEAYTGTVTGERRQGWNHAAPDLNSDLWNAD